MYILCIKTFCYLFLLRYAGIEREPDRKWKDFGGEEYSEEYGECDIFEGRFSGILGS